MQFVNRESAADLDVDALAEVYAYPSRLERPWTRVNFVTSVDGVATVDGRSGGLAHPADAVLFPLIRDLADVVLVGAGTAVAEGYSGIARRDERTRARRSWGLSDVPPIAVVTKGATLDPDAPVLTDTDVAPLVVTCARADPDRVRAYRAAGAEVLVAGETDVDLPWLLGEFGRRGWSRVVCEGGPGLFAAMLDADLVDELCLTVSPLLVGGAAQRVLGASSGSAPQQLRLDSVVRAQSALLLRYHTARADERLREMA